AAIGDVTKDEDDAGDSARAIANGRTAVVDGSLGAVGRDQDGAVGQADDVTLAEDAGDRALDDLPALLVHDAKDVRADLPASVGRAPPGQAFGDRIHEDDPPLSVGRDHGATDAFERAFQPFPLL